MTRVHQSSMKMARHFYHKNGVKYKTLSQFSSDHITAIWQRPITIAHTAHLWKFAAVPSGFLIPTLSIFIKCPSDDLCCLVWLTEAGDVINWLGGEFIKGTKKINTHVGDCWLPLKGVNKSPKGQKQLAVLLHVMNKLHFQPIYPTVCSVDERPKKWQLPN